MLVWGFLEVVGNAVVVDVTKQRGDMDKLLKGLLTCIYTSEFFIFIYGKFGYFIYLNLTVYPTCGWWCGCVK